MTEIASHVGALRRWGLKTRRAWPALLMPPLHCTSGERHAINKALQARTSTRSLPGGGSGPRSGPPAWIAAGCSAAPSHMPAHQQVPSVRCAVHAVRCADPAARHARCRRCLLLRRRLGGGLLAGAGVGPGCLPSPSACGSHDPPQPESRQRTAAEVVFGRRGAGAWVSAIAADAPVQLPALLQHSSWATLCAKTLPALNKQQQLRPTSWSPRDTWLKFSSVTVARRSTVSGSATPLPQSSALPACGCREASACSVVREEWSVAALQVSMLNRGCVAAEVRPPMLTSSATQAQHTASYHTRHTQQYKLLGMAAPAGRLPCL